jgi:ABC-type multidrug transport system fused ATPase/permease subunit
MCICSAVLLIASLPLQMHLFSLAGVRLTARLRVAAFSAMLRQEIGWFDDEKNSVGTLCARLSGDAASVQGVSEWLKTFYTVKLILIRIFICCTHIIRIFCVEVLISVWSLKCRALGLLGTQDFHFVVRKI